MQKISLLLIVFAVVLTACGNAAPTPVASASEFVSSTLDVSYEGALSARNQLALGSIKLDGTPNTLTAKQAATMLPLWQALRSANQSGNAQAEVTALLTQLEQAFTSKQLQDIKAMKLTQSIFQEWAKANGITLGSGLEGGGGPGSGANLSASEKATRQASATRTNAGNSASTAVVDAVIKYLGTIK